MAAEKALLYNNKKFPPMLPRVLRVTRAKKVTKKATKTTPHTPQGREKADAAAPTKSKAKYMPKINSAAQSLSGRARKLFGRAGAAHFRVGTKSDGGPGNVAKAPEHMVFEGYRASRKQGSGRRQPRRTSRSVAFKAKGGKKAKST